MITFNTLMLIAHVLIAASIIGLVMLQKGKGADAGAGFGAGASGTVFGARGSTNFLSRSTAVAATLFFASSLGLAYLNRNAEGPSSLLDSATVEESVAIEPLPATEDLNLELELPPLNEPETATNPGTADPAMADDELPVVPE